MLGNLKRRVQKLGRQIVGYDNRIKAAEKRVGTLTDAIDRKEIRLEALTERADRARKAG